MDCYTCLALSGEKPIFPESRMYDGKYWMVEHAYPVKIKGWLVIILKRHIESLHELVSEEFAELATLQDKLPKILHKELNTVKEYSVCFAEGKHFNHIHFHLIAKTDEFPKEAKGPSVFSLLMADEMHAVPKEELVTLCAKIKKSLATY